MKHLIIGFTIAALFFGIRYLYFKPKFIIGSNAPNFAVELENMENFDFKNYYSNKLVLLDFWGSWCGPCRAENPDLVKLYTEFHDKSFLEVDNFEIVGIGIETDEKSWKNAIEKDGLLWPIQIVQKDKFSSPIAKLYGINEIPTSYLINNKGKIVGVNMTYDQLKNYLNSKLAPK